jgi:hypothetical protein
MIHVNESVFFSIIIKIESMHLYIYIYIYIKEN